MDVIIADDSMVVRSIVARAITPLGYRPLPAVNGKAAIEILEKSGNGVGLILMDWNMPVLDGIQALSEIKADRRFSSIPVIMLTSESDDNKVKQAFVSGAAAYVKKPFTPDELVQTIRGVLNTG